MAAAGVGKLWHVCKDGFSINRISCVLFSEAPPALQQAPVDELKGPFRYLGRGRQCYAFESFDERFVLKIPRFDRYDLPFRWKMPFSWLDSGRAEIWKDRQNRLVFTIESFRIAERELKEDTALIYLHIHETKDLPSRVVLFDRMGRSFPIDLNRITFVLQEKKPLMIPQLLGFIAKNDRVAAEKIIDSFLSLVKRRAKLAIFNKDPSFMKNFAWENQTAVQIDIGSFFRKENPPCKETTLQSMKEGCGPFREWLGGFDRDLLCYFDKRLEEECDSL